MLKHCKASFFPTFVYGALHQFQSTHPRGVRRWRGQEGKISQKVSIHAPSWGATGQQKEFDALPMFQSTHPRGVRPINTNNQSISICFNPRTLVGCDLAKTISGSHHDGFNPRTLVGCDRRSDEPWKSSTWFQSTHPRGVRLENRLEQYFAHQ